MADTIATITGTALVPGVSKNRRWYKDRHLRGAAEAATRRLAAGDNPMNMLTHHAAGDDSTKITARLTKVHMTDEGTLDWAAEIASTDPAKSIATLLDTTDGKPAFLKNVSIRGYWTGKVHRVEGPDGDPVETGEGLELDGIDFTKNPGVPQAEVKTFAWTGDGGRSETSERVMIFETTDDVRVSFTEEAPAAEIQPAALPAGLEELHLLGEDGECVSCPAEARVPLSKRGSGVSGPGGPYADTGFLPDGKQRYQLDTKAHAKGAWSFISVAKNAAQYSGSQLARIKRRIIAALKKFGVTVNTKEAALAGWCFETPVRITGPAGVDLLEMEEAQCGSWQIAASNGPLNLSLSCWSMDPVDLATIVPAAARAATACLRALDPDMDGDVDVSGVSHASDPDGDASQTHDDGDDIEDDAADAADPADETDPAPEPAAGTTEERNGAAMGEPTTAAAGTATVPFQITQAQLDEALARTAAAAAAAAVEAAENARRARKAARTGGTQAPAGQSQETQSQAGQTATEPAPDAQAGETDEELAARIAQEVLTAEGLGPETREDRVKRLAQGMVDKGRQDAVASGRVSVVRGGLTADGPADESGVDGNGVLGETNEWGMPKSYPNKPPWEYTELEKTQYLDNPLAEHVIEGVQAARLTKLGLGHFLES